jgi:hypothetical protein
VVASRHADHQEMLPGNGSGTAPSAGNGGSAAASSGLGLGALRLGLYRRRLGLGCDDRNAQNKYRHPCRIRPVEHATHLSVDKLILYGFTSYVKVQ